MQHRYTDIILHARLRFSYLMQFLSQDTYLSLSLTEKLFQLRPLEAFV
jgi:hypothetical protein